MQKQKNAHPFNVRIPADTWERMQQASQQNRRTLTSFIVAGVQRELDAIDTAAHYKTCGSPSDRATASTS